MLNAKATTNISEDNTTGIDLSLEMHGRVSEIVNELATIVGETLYRVAKKKEDSREMLLVAKNLTRTAFRASAADLTYRICLELQSRGFSEAEATALITAIQTTTKDISKDK